MKRTAVAAFVGGLMFLLAAPAHAQTGPQLIFCGYPVQVCAPADPGARAAGAQQQQQQQQQVTVERAAAVTAPAATATAAATASPATGSGGGRVAFTGANVFRLSGAAIVLMAGGAYLLLKSRRRSRWLYER